IRGNVREMPERSDEEKPLAWQFRFGAEALEIDPVLQHDAGLQEFRVLFTHYHYTAVAPDGGGFETAPAPRVPGSRERARAAGDLYEEVERDIVLHQDVAGVFGK